MAKNVKEQKQVNNVTHIRRIPKITSVMVILSVILIYMIIQIVVYMTSEKVLTYEVSAGQLVSDNTFSGIIIYDESISTSTHSGYVNYFLSDNTKAGVNTIICSIDETGTVSSQLSSIMEENQLSDSTLTSIRKQLTDYSSKAENTYYYQAYNILDDITAEITEYNSSYMLDSLEKAMEDTNNFVNIVKPQKASLISFSMDSLFGLTTTQVTKETFNKENYSKTNLKNRTLIGVNDILFRTINSEKWNIVFELSENQVTQYANVSNVKIKFLSNNLTTSAIFSIINNTDGSYGMLTLDKYLINFVNERFVDFEISESSTAGLKIPITSVCEKEFFTIPEEYGFTADDTKKTGFLQITYDSQGNQSRKFVEATFYNNEDGYIYVDKSLFEIGDSVVKPPKEGEITTTDEIYIIGTVASLKGTYCVNKGYCLFRKVVILDKNTEYYIIEKGTKYGLSIYDHIILNSDMFSEYDIIRSH